MAQDDIRGGTQGPGVFDGRRQALQVVAAWKVLEIGFPKADEAFPKQLHGEAVHNQ